MKVDLTFQGKGGVGKSFVASMLAWHYKTRDLPLICIDTDPTNATFAGYKALNVDLLDLLVEGDVDQRQFDQLVERIAAPDVNPDTVMVVDNGAASFQPLGQYLVQSQALPMLMEMGHDVRLHSVLTGGQAVQDTLHGLLSTVENFPDVPIIVWFNTYFGPVHLNGIPVEELDQYREIQDHIYAEIRVPTAKAETFGVDMKKMLQRRETFDQVLTSPDYSIMERQRLTMMKNAMAAVLKEARL